MPLLYPLTQSIRLLTVRGSWSCWTSWSPCSASCGGGHYQRTRSCTSPVPSPGEDICLGLHTEEALCSTEACPGTECTKSLGRHHLQSPAVNLVPTHHPQKAGHPGRSGVLVLKMEARVEAATARSCSRGPAAVQETAARAAPAPTVKSLVGPGANTTFIPALPT